MNLFSTRCHIRSFEENDLEAFMNYRNNPDWMNYQGFKGLSKEEYRKHLLGNTSVLEGKQLAIADRNTEMLLGDLYLQQEEACFWIGYTISPEYAQKGYAYEAVQTLIDYLKSTNCITIKAGVLPQNKASIHLLKKLGFSFVGQDNEEDIYALEFS